MMDYLVNLYKLSVFFSSYQKSELDVVLMFFNARFLTVSATSFMKLFELPCLGLVYTHKLINVVDVSLKERSYILNTYVHLSVRSRYFDHHMISCDKFLVAIFFLLSSIYLWKKALTFNKWSLICDLNVPC